MIMKKTVAPNFKLRNQKNEIIDLKAYLGKRVVLFFADDMSNLKVQTTMAFYAKKQAELESLDVKVLAVVGNSLEEMKAQCNYLQLPYNVLCDTQKEVRKRYEVWNKKITFGKECWVTSPYGFVLNEHGIVIQIFKRMYAPAKQTQVLDYVQHLVKKMEWAKLSRRKKERIRREQTSLVRDIELSCTKK